MGDSVISIVSKGDLVRAKAHCAGAAAYRYQLEYVRAASSSLPKPRWVDAGIDSLASSPSGWSQSWRPYLESLSDETPELLKLLEDKTPAKASVERFASDCMDRLLEVDPDWVTVPQLPAAKQTDTFRYSLYRKINRQLAKAVGAWLSAREEEEESYVPYFVLPVIVTHPSQISSKASRSHVIKNTETCFKQARADIIWIVDSSLHDQAGTGNFETSRFPDVLRLHSEFRECFTDVRVIGGPYWGLNLVLWSRGLSDHPMYGPGGGYRYYLSGGRGSSDWKHRVAIPSLRRWAECGSDEFHQWLADAVSVDPTLGPLLQRFPAINASPDNCRDQIAEFYSEWVRLLQATAPSQRAVTLYQDLSRAYVTGNSILGVVGELPEKSLARIPGRIAKQLMMSCLSPLP